MEVWADELALWIWAGGQKADLEPLKASKARLGVTERIMPKLLTRPDGHISPPPAERVLSIGYACPWLIDYFLVDEFASDAEWDEAVLWALGFSENPKATTVADVYASIMPGTREIPPAELEAEKKMADYIQGLD